MVKSGVWRRYADWCGTLMKPEQLEELPGPPSESKRRSFVSWILKSESLPWDEASVDGKRPSFPLWLLTPETLPTDDAPDPRAGRTSFFTTLFSREILPVDPVPDPAPGSRPARH